MKKRKKGSVVKEQKASHSSRKKILGADMKSLIAAIAMAVVGEIAQSVINRVVRGVRESDQNEPGHSDLKETTNSTRSAIENIIPLIGASDLVKQVLEEVRPAIDNLIEAVIGAPAATQQAAASAVGNAVETVDSSTYSTEIAHGSVNAVQQASGAVVEAVQGSLQNGIAGLAEAVRGAVQPVVEQVEDTELKEKKKKKKKGKKKK